MKIEKLKIKCPHCGKELLVDLELDVDIVATETKEE